MIAPSEPGALVGCSEQCLNLRTGEEVHLRACKTLAGNSQNALDLGGLGRRFERDIPKEGADCGEAQVAAAHTELPVLLQVIKKTNDQGCVDCLQRKLCRRRVQLLMCEFQQHAKGVAVGTDRMWTDLPL